MSTKSTAALQIQFYEALHTGIGGKNTPWKFLEAQVVEISVLESFRSSGVLFKVPQ